MVCCLRLTVSAVGTMMPAKGLSGSHLNSGTVLIQSTQESCCWSKHQSYTEPLCGSGQQGAREGHTYMEVD